MIPWRFLVIVWGTCCAIGNWMMRRHTYSQKRNKCTHGVTANHLHRVYPPGKTFKSWVWWKYMLHFKSLWSKYFLCLIHVCVISSVTSALATFSNMFWIKGIKHKLNINKMISFYSKCLISRTRNSFVAGKPYMWRLEIHVQCTECIRKSCESFFTIT